MDVDAFAAMFVNLSNGLRVEQLIVKDADQQASLMRDMFRIMVTALKKVE